MDNYYISLSFKLVTILLLTIVIICYCFIKHRLKQKDVLHIHNIKMPSNNELKEISIKIPICNYFDDISNINEVDVNNTLLDGTTHVA